MVLGHSSIAQFAHADVSPIASITWTRIAPSDIFGNDVATVIERLDLPLRRPSRSARELAQLGGFESSRCLRPGPSPFPTTVKLGRAAAALVLCTTLVAATGRRGLLLQGFTRLGNQPRVLHRDHGLRRKVLQQRDLPVCKTGGLLSDKYRWRQARCQLSAVMPRGTCGPRAYLRRTENSEARGKHRPRGHLQDK